MSKPWRAPKNGGYQAISDGRPKPPPPVGRGAGSPPIRPAAALVKPDPNSSRKALNQLMAKITRAVETAGPCPHPATLTVTGRPGVTWCPTCGTYFNPDGTQEVNGR